jgi:putative inorganic carbon (hco3(-)) transporter
VEHTDAAQVSALLGALGAVLVLLPRNRFLALAGFALLGVAGAGLGRSLVGDDDVELLLTEPTGLALGGVGVVAAVLGAVPLARYPAVVPVVLLAAAPFRIPIQVGDEDAFLLLPLYFVLTSSVLALGYRMLRDNGDIPVPPRLLTLPIAAFVAFAAASFTWTWDEREGGIALAFFVFPFVAGLGVVARAPLAPWLPRALVFTLAGLGTLFAAIGLWQAQTRTLFFSPTLEVANAYTSFFRVTSMFKDPSLFGRYLVVPIAVLLVVILVRRNRTIDWIAATALIAFLFAGLYYSYSQSSFVALFVVVFALAFFAGTRRLRLALVACALVAALAAGAIAAQSIDGRSARDVTSGRSRLVAITLDAFELRPATGVGIGGQPQASAEASGRRSANRNASHTTPLTVLAELGLVGFALYAWMLGAVAWGLVLLTREQRAFGVGLGAVLLILFVHSLLYAGFFEDPLTWGVFGLTAAGIAATTAARAPVPVPAEPVPRRALVAGTLTRALGRPVSLMPRPLRWILLVVSVLVLALGGALLAIGLMRDTPRGALDTELEDVTVSTSTKPAPAPKPPPPEPAADKRCWRTFGADPQRSLARATAQLGLPERKPLWSRGMRSYIEYPPTYCDGDLYVNTFEGATYSIEAETGKVNWRRRVGGTLPSSPAIDGPRVIVASQSGTVTALDRDKGRVLWQVTTGGKVESSPVVVDGLVYFGSHDGRLFAVNASTGRIRWAYSTGGRINASPSVFGGRVCAGNYSGAILCLDKDTGRRIWITYVSRDAFRRESFYASASTDGERLYSVARSGRVVALNASNGDIVWTGHVGGLGYTTPAVAGDRVFVGGFDGRLRALRARDGTELWNTWVGGRILGAPVVIGDYVFFSTLEKRTYALRVSDGDIAWRLPLGRYSPGIATERTYFFTLNGRLIAFRGRDAPKQRAS